MSHDRVIQDSDDEDDPLSEMPPPMKRPPEQSQEISNTDAVDESIEIIEHRNGHQQSEIGDHIGVDFDAFLQSQETVHNGLSASQQQREERWIPSNAGGAGSIGSVMTEIGLAQQRLFDDEDAQHTGAHVPHLAVHGEAVMPLNMAVSNYHDYHPQGFSGITQPNLFTGLTSQDMALLNANKHGYGYSNNDITGFYGDHVLPVVPSKNMSSHDFAQSSTSYNFFDSSLNLPTPAKGPLQSSMGSHGTIPTEVAHKTPARSHSMHATPYSPHDTEPLSSLASPRLGRAKSDTASRDSLLQSSTSACDELSVSVAIEVPMLKDKRVLKWKQHPPEDDEDDELALSNVEESIPIGLVEKRRPGRPPKNTRIMDIVSSNIEMEFELPQGRSAGTPEDFNGPQNAPIFNDRPSTHAAIYGATHDIPRHEEVQVIITDISKEDKKNISMQLPADIDAPTAKPSKKMRESKKKKLKRGKTTSVTLKKTYESDVEDDVIWIDERPSSPTHQAKQAPQHPIHDSHLVKGDHNETTNIEILNPQLKPFSVADGDGNETIPNTLDEEPSILPPAPKKRGRKRKKTSELAISETPFAPIENTEINGDINHGPQSGNVSVVLEKPSDETTTNNNQINNTTIPCESTSLPESLSPTKPSTVEPKTPVKHPTSPIPEQNGTTTDPKTKQSNRGPDKHSPIAATSKVPYRVGLSRRARIAPLLKIVRR